ncbi:SWIM zinc finger domain-containing protein [Bradyrhizobium erythrophlei]|uniref:SWIM zinc finger family protein n=1 Tax=Bradyrhizobium erythrophlei TaxID=1437360 RepID=UPI0035E69818
MPFAELIGRVDEELIRRVRFRNLRSSSRPARGTDTVKRSDFGVGSRGSVRVTQASKRDTQDIEAAARPARFDVAVLRDIAGEKAFNRGSAYQADGRVEIMTIDEARVVARVVGTESYRCELTGRGRSFSGNCSCRAFDDWGFCKHLVATALAVNCLKPDALEQTANRLDKIRDHLRARGVEQLTTMILKLAERDSALFEELALSTALETTDDPTLLAQFKKAITDATRVRGYIEYRDMRDWAQGIERVLDRLSILLESGRASLVLQLLDHFFARMDDALAKVDDSDGGAGACYAKACGIHLAACQKAKPDPVDLARTLFAREVDSDWEFFFGASETYAEVLGKAGLAEYRSLATEAWKKAKSKRGKKADDRPGDGFALRAMMERFAEREDDIDGIIAVRSGDLSSAYDYLGIAQVCLDNGREQEALKWAEEGLWKFEDSPDQRLVLFACDLYQRKGRNENATELLWRTFAREPRIGLYERLKSTAGADRMFGIAVRDRAIALLREQAAKSRPQGRWPLSSETADVLIRLLLTEGLVADAWAAVGNHGCREGLMEELARASESDHPDEALKAYAQLVERRVRTGGQANYEAAYGMIERMRGLRERLDESTQHAAYLADLKDRHKARRNFIKLLMSSGTR